MSTASPEPWVRRLLDVGRSLVTEHDLEVELGHQGAPDVQQSANPRLRRGGAHPSVSLLRAAIPVRAGTHSADGRRRSGSASVRGPHAMPGPEARTAGTISLVTSPV